MFFLHFCYFKASSVTMLAVENFILKENRIIIGWNIFLAFVTLNNSIDIFFLYNNTVIDFHEAFNHKTAQEIWFKTCFVSNCWLQFFFVFFFVFSIIHCILLIYNLLNCLPVVCIFWYTVLCAFDSFHERIIVMTRNR